MGRQSTGRPSMSTAGERNLVGVRLEAASSGPAAGGGRPETRRNLTILGKKRKRFFFRLVRPKISDASKHIKKARKGQVVQSKLALARGTAARVLGRGAQRMRWGETPDGFGGLVDHSLQQQYK